MANVSGNTAHKPVAQFSDSAILERLAPVYGGVPFELPAQTLPQDVRAMRRMAWRNSHNLYHRKCDRSGKKIISGFPAGSRYPVYATDIWWGDSWDQNASGREFDFTRSFFDQFQELMTVAPRPALMSRNSENSDYCNYAGDNKDCYMANNGSWYNERCINGESYLHCRDCLDCSYLRKSELCYEAVACEGLYDCAFIVNSYHSAQCYFSFNLRNCQDCFLCSNLRGKRNYILNRPATKEAIAELRKKMQTSSGLAELAHRYDQLRRESFHPATNQVACEDCSGEYLSHCKNVQNGYLVGAIRDGRNLIHCDEGSDLWDCSLSGYGGSELYYETISSGAGGQRVLFCSGSWSSSNVVYCDTVMSCLDCFGCVGLIRKQHCILNRQYSPDEYESLCARIVEHMRQSGEWGEFFPEWLAPHAYNESSGPDFYQIDQERAEELGYRWLPSADAPKQHSGVPLPSSIFGVADDITEQIFACEQTGRAFRISPLELTLLRKMEICPSPYSPEARRVLRTEKRNPARLSRSSCSACGAAVETSFAPGSGLNIFCSDCYQKELFG